jgi:hypothetical protein
MREQRPFLARIENPIQLKSCLGKNVHRYRSLSLHLLLHVACWNNILSLTKNVWEVHAEPQDLDMWFLAIVIFSDLVVLLWVLWWCGLDLVTHAHIYIHTWILKQYNPRKKCGQPQDLDMWFLALVITF